ncbi:hypothetical protein UFOVP811_44 [uncultured Caudovirales phage]|uniref:Uncharacterized protein n=1 Tax=uncultured Caudovirales phage TaxID=2100421 RepID=A0A6J5NXA3_9CAUD|nr:hypothetical protein UFOVP811_44 [uncultured Caudovirales phage]
MTDEQINQRIAEACGWRWDQGYRWKDSSGLSAFAWDISDYCNDLNAMHEAERVLKGYEQIHTYIWHLSNRNDWETDFKLMEVHISARDRAEAFLRTLGKWEEATDKESLTVESTTEQSSSVHIGNTTEMMKEVQK